MIGVCLFLAALIWFVFGQTLGFDFVNYDDNDYVLKNAEVNAGLTWRGLLWAFTQVHSANWHPLTWISHMLDCQLYGLHPAGHHLTNLLLHTATALSLFLVLRQMTGALWRSAFVAAVFAIHPLRVESVAWIAERKDVLSGLFFVWTIGAYAHFTRQPRPLLRYAFVLMLFVLGLMSKPMLVTVPFVLLLLDYWPLQRTGLSPQRLILEKIPLLLLAVASSIITLVAQRAASVSLLSAPLSSRIGNALISLAIYLRQFFWPSDLAAFYPWSNQNTASMPVALSGALHILISALVFRFRGQRYLATGWLWYLVMLAPVIGIVKVGTQAHADRYTYLPQIGWCILLTWLAADLLKRRGALGGFAFAAILALAFVAREQAAVWRNSETLWTHSIAHTAAHPRAHVNLGEAFYEQGKLQAAAEQYAVALQLEPNESTAHSALGVALLELGRAEESIAHLEEALRLNPRDAEAHYNLGNSYLQTRRFESALLEYARALELEPDDFQALNNRAWILATCADPALRNGALAVPLAERADQLTRGANPVVQATLAAAYAESGRFPEAIRSAESAIKLATAEGNMSRADSLRLQLARYQSNLPWR